MAAALERALGGGSEAPLPPLPVLVLGPAGSGRTSLLLRTALAGGADGPRTLFLAPSAIPRLPGGPGGAGPDPRALQRLELRYPRSRRALCRELLARVWLCAQPPALLLLDGLERYVGRCPAVPWRLAALLLELTRGAPAAPQLVAALRCPPAGPQLLAPLLRFFPARCRLSPARGHRPGAGRARVTLRCPGSAPRRWRLRLGRRGAGDGEGDSDSDSDSDSDRGDSDSDSDSGCEGDGDSEERWA